MGVLVSVCWGYTGFLVTAVLGMDVCFGDCVLEISSDLNQ